MEEKLAVKPSRETLKKVAKELAMVELNEEELKELGRILGEISKLRELDIPEVEPATVFRV